MTCPGHKEPRPIGWFNLINHPVLFYAQQSLNSIPVWKREVRGLTVLLPMNEMDPLGDESSAWIFVLINSVSPPDDTFHPCAHLLFKCCIIIQRGVQLIPPTRTTAGHGRTTATLSLDTLWSQKYHQTFPGQLKAKSVFGGNSSSMGTRLIVPWHHGCTDGQEQTMLGTKELSFWFFRFVADQYEILN